MCNTYRTDFWTPLFTGSRLFNHVVIGNVSFDYKNSEYLLITPPAIHFLYEKKKKNRVVISPGCALQGMLSYLD